MPLPRALARANRRVTNRIMQPLARRLSGFAVVHHLGRRSGTPYSTPINYFRSGPSELVVALTYGPESDWVANVEASPARIELQGSIVGIVAIDRIARSEAWEHLPGPVRLILRVIDVNDFIRLTLEDSSSGNDATTPAAD